MSRHSLLASVSLVLALIFAGDVAQPGNQPLQSVAMAVWAISAVHFTIAAARAPRGPE